MKKLRAKLWLVVWDVAAALRLPDGVYLWVLERAAKADTATWTEEAP